MSTYKTAHYSRKRLECTKPVPKSTVCHQVMRSPLSIFLVPFFWSTHLKI